MSAQSERPEAPPLLLAAGVAFWGWQSGYYLAALAIAPGPRWRWIAAPVTLDDFGPLPSLCVPHFKLKPHGDIRTFLTAYANAGGPHHNAVCFGDARQRLRLAGKGMTRPHGAAGDLYAVLSIAVPSVLSESERKLFEELRIASRFNPRGHFAQ